MLTFPCRIDKSPAIPKGTSWATQVTDGPPPTPVYGIPIPPGIFVIDLDLYKGVTRQQVNDATGCQIPWDTALIQHTQNGGDHFAFRVDPSVEWTNSSNLLGIKGLDTRAAGKGYIASGRGYTQAGTAGVNAFSYPHILPELPEAAARVFRQPDRRPATAPPQAETSVIRQALAHISPDCDRQAWVRVGLALRNALGPDAEPGLFDEWSSGALHGGRMPHNYEPEVIEHQWRSFKAEGKTTAGTLYYLAIQGGWRPPRGIDTGAAFNQFGQLLDAILANAGNPKHWPTLTAAVQCMGGDSMQIAALLALLAREIKEAGLMTPAVKKELSKATAPPAGEYGGNHTDNALQFIAARYPDDTLRYCDEVWYSYNGMVWVEKQTITLKQELTRAMIDFSPQASTIQGTLSQLANLVSTDRKINTDNGHNILYQNGVLNLYTGQFGPHTPHLFTTLILPYNYNPTARCDTWLAFLWDIFDGDQERLDLLQEWFGYMLSPTYEHHKIMALLGPPRGGKGTVAAALERLVGVDLFAAVDINDIVTPAALESLQHKSVAVDGDMVSALDPRTSRAILAKLKTISGGDAVGFNRKYKSHMTCRLPTRFTFACNQMPAFFDDSGALTDRLLLLVFDKSFLGREDLTLGGKIAAEVEGIATWALHGLHRLRQRGKFTEPETSSIEREDIRESSSPLVEFVESKCRFGGGVVTRGEELYDAYKSWIMQRGSGHVMAYRIFISSFKATVLGRGLCKYGRYSVNNSARFRGFYDLQLVNTTPVLRLV